MRIVVAPDSFKGALSAAHAAAAIANGLRQAHPDAVIELCPMADGGEGTLDVLLAAHRGQRRRVNCHGPRGDPIQADVGLIDRASTAVIELASAAGLTLVPPDRRDPLNCTTAGVGELIRAAIESGVDQIILTLGGSATVDGGCGLAQSLGLALYDKSGRPLPNLLPPARFTEITRMDAAPLMDQLGDVEITIAADVLNPLLGPNGAAAVFAPQKGADPATVGKLESGLAHWVGLLERACGHPIRDEPGAGAAGGAALPLLAFASAVIVPGADLVIAAAQLREKIALADLVITGEGRLDRQSMMGKAVGAVARLAQSADVACIALVGALGEGHEEASRGLHRVIALTRPGDDPVIAIRETRERLAAAARLL